MKRSTRRDVWVELRTPLEKAFDTTANRLLVMSSGDGAMMSTDGGSWQGPTLHATPSSPFEAGPNDFFACAWDGARQQIVLFDATAGRTWTLSEAEGWAQQTSVAPPRWDHPEGWRTEADLADGPMPYMPEEGPYGDCYFRNSGTPEGFGMRNNTDRKSKRFPTRAGTIQTWT